MKVWYCIDILRDEPTIECQPAAKRSCLQRPEQSATSVKAPITDSMSYAIGEASPDNDRFSLTNSTFTPRVVSVATSERRSTRLRASLSIE